MQLNKNLTRKITLLSTTLAILPLVVFLSLILSPTLSPESTSATSETSEVAVGIEEVLSLRIVKQNSSTGEWDVDTDTISTRAAHGEFGSAMVKVIASTNGRGGYQLSMNDTDSNNKLVSAATLDEIPALASSVTLADITDTTEAFTAGRWGYSWAKNNGDNPSLTFNAMPTTETLMDNTSDLGVNTYNFTLGVRATETTPAATYTDQIMFSLVGNPAPDSPLFYRTEYMQNFTQTICNTVKTPLASTTDVTADTGSDYSYSGDHATKVPSTKVKDKRDEQEYTIRKLADGNCWMTESLRFGTTPENGTKDWSQMTDPTTNTNTTSAGATKLANTFNSTRMSSAAGCGTLFNNTEDNQTNPSVCTVDANTPNTVDTSYNTVKFGALYNYCAASGGTVCSNTPSMSDIPGAIDNTHESAPKVSGSICPTNWSLPQMTGNPSGSGGSTTGYNADNAYSYSYNNLLNNYTVDNASSEYTKLLPLPLEFVRAGLAWSRSLHYRGANGNYWSSTPYTSTNVNAYYLVFGFSNVSRSDYNRAYGFSVRCVLAS